jgi:hypothetical protein
MKVLKGSFLLETDSSQTRQAGSTRLSMLLSQVFR